MDLHLSSCFGTATSINGAKPETAARVGLGRDLRSKRAQRQYRAAGGEDQMDKREAWRCRATGCLSCAGQISESPDEAASYLRRPTPLAVDLGRADGPLPGGHAPRAKGRPSADGRYR